MYMYVNVHVDAQFHDRMQEYLNDVQNLPDPHSAGVKIHTDQGIGRQDSHIRNAFHHSESVLQIMHIFSSTDSDLSEIGKMEFLPGL